MKYNIFGFSQEKVLSLSRVIVDKNGKEKDIYLDISDLMILQVMGDFMNRSKIIKYTINDKTYFNVQYKIILQDLPILKIKQQALTDRLNKMVELEVLEKEIVRNQSGSYSVFRIGEKYEELKYDRRSSELPVQMYSTTCADVVDYKPKHYSTNNYSTNTTNTKDDKDKSLSKKEKSVSVDLWKNDYSTYKQMILDASTELKSDKEFRLKQEAYFPNINYEMSIDKGCDYWLSDIGYKKCKQAKNTINILSRLKNNFDKNKIYYGYNQSKPQLDFKESNDNELIINGTRYK